MAIPSSSPAKGAEPERETASSAPSAADASDGADIAAAAAVAVLVGGNGVGTGTASATLTPHRSGSPTAVRRRSHCCVWSYSSILGVMSHFALA